MKKIILGLIGFITITLSANAQQIDKTILKCVYRYDFTPRIGSARQLTLDTMMLEIGNKCCKFYSYYNHTILSAMEKSDRGTWMSFPKRTDNKYTIYLNYPDDKITVFTDAVGALNAFEYIDDFEIPKWEILDETITLLSHICKKATCRYRGRDWVAWYAIDIPISRGPYKFAGLPGLIMKIYDTENMYNFECIAIEKANEPMYKDKEEGMKTLLTTRKEFIAMEKRNCDNPKAAMIELIGINNYNDIKHLVPEDKKLRYCPMELE